MGRYNDLADYFENVLIKFWSDTKDRNPDFMLRTIRNRALSMKYYVEKNFKIGEVKR